VRVRVCVCVCVWVGMSAANVYKYVYVNVCVGGYGMCAITNHDSFMPQQINHKHNTA